LIANLDKIKIFFTTFLLMLNFYWCFSQPSLPQRYMTVNPTQMLQFGTFFLTGISGGEVIVNWDGSRLSTGGIALLSSSPTAQPAIFEIKLCQGRNVTINYSSSTTLTGSNGGTLNLQIGPSEKGSSGVLFSTNNDCNFITPLRIGGKLQVPGNAIPGTYTGSFFITFNQE
jgi:hypothetical protein